MMRRNLQSAGGTGGTLFSALMLVIIVICFITYCYRRSIYNFNNRGRHDVEVIIETTADMCDTNANFAEVGGLSDPIPAPSEVGLDSAHEAEKKKNVLLWLNDTIRSSSERSCCSSVEIAVAYEYDLTRGGTSSIQARPIRVMESYQSSDLTSNGVLNANADYPFHDIENDRLHHNDYDYLIETERNMYEFNSDFQRVSSSNEAALALSLAAQEAQQGNAARSADPSRTSIDETDTALPVNLNANNSGTQRVHGPRREQNTSMFFSNNSANRATLVGDRNRRNNDVCAQQ